MRTALLMLTLAACSAPVEPTAALDPGLTAQLQDAVDAGRIAAGAPGTVVSVYVPGVGAWVGTSGWEDKENDVHAGPWGRYRIASITKTFTASVILELQAEGKLDLDETVADFLPQAPYGDRITLRMLLSHTSGLDDYVDQLGFLGQPTKAWAPWELIALVADKPLLFEPGTGYSYSNAGYILLGLVIEAITEQPWESEVHERLIDPWRLLDVSTPTSQPGTDTDVVGYIGGNPATDVYTPYGAWSAGEMVSDANDLTEWATYLYGGQVLPQTQLEEMTTGTMLASGNRIHYGLGCELRTLDGRQTVGHSGSTVGFETTVRYDVLSGVAVSVLTNDFNADASAVDDAVWQVLVDQQVFDLVP